MALGVGLAAIVTAGALTTGAPPAPAPFPSAPPPSGLSAGATIYLMDQIATGPLPPEVLKAMEPLHSLDEVEALLKSKKIAFAWREAEISTQNIDPQVVGQVAALPPHEVFIAPQGAGWIASVVLSARPAAAAPSPPPVTPRPPTPGREPPRRVPPTPL
jgi:hypothetical protein